MNLKNILVFVVFVVVVVESKGQWIDPWQIRPAPDSNMILGSIKPYYDAEWIYRDSFLKGVIIPNGGVDSIYLSNDTIYLRDGDGFVKLPQGGGGDGNATDELQDLYPYSTGFVLSHTTLPQQDTVIFEYTNSIVSTAPGSCDCTIEDIPNLNTELESKANLQHLHNISDVVGLLGALDGKASATHTHNISDVTGLQTALDGKENSFSKGSLIEGTNVTLSGNLTNRLVGSGDITISATGGGGALTIEESVSTSSQNLTTSNATLNTLSLTAGTWKVDGVITLLENQTTGKTVTVEIFNSTSGNSLISTAQYISGLNEFNVAITKRIVLSTTSTIIIRARTSNGTAIATSRVMTAIK